ncbi:MAG TPA: hypothetical protein DE179_11270, partial [Oceanospirillaceae bacterium]|nr:hypothetical protein [Oceanospirillaceae bacterium]
MKLINQTLITVAAVTAASTLLVTSAVADMYRVTSIAPGMSPFVVNTSIAKVVSKHNADIQ